MEWDRRKNKVTITLVGINVIVFLGLSMIGMTEDAAFMLGKGALYTPYVIVEHQYYRVITSMFLHYGIQHLGNNMLLLVLLGATLEQEMGSFKYALLYFVSGIAGNILTIIWDLLGESYAISAGASGAVFGVIGGMLWVVIRNRGRIGTITSRGLIVMIGLSLYYGLTTSGIGNLAHIGGLITGFIVSVLLYRKRNYENSPFA